VVPRMVPTVFEKVWFRPFLLLGDYHYFKFFVEKQLPEITYII